MNYTTSYQSNRPTLIKPKQSKRPLLLLALLLLAGIGVWWLFGRSSPKIADHQNQTANQEATTPTPEPPALADLSGLQTVVDDWVESHGGTYAVTIKDESGDTIAAVNEDTEFFTASIYKLYVAYEGYQQVADSAHNMDDAYLSGYNRGECLDAMIRSSYSPCGEKMWVEIGKDTLTTKLKTYGLTGTSMTGLRTTSHDAAIILHRLYIHKDLSEKYADLYLDSMKTQDAKFRRGLPSGFEDATVYNKVGWNENIEWHDTAIVEFKNGRVLHIAVLTKSAGSKNIAGLAGAIETFVSSQ